MNERTNACTEKAWTPPHTHTTQRRDLPGQGEKSPGTKDIASASAVFSLRRVLSAPSQASVSPAAYLLSCAGAGDVGFSIWRGLGSSGVQIGAPSVLPTARLAGGPRRHPGPLSARSAQGSPRSLQGPCSSGLGDSERVSPLRRASPLASSLHLAAARA
jgi:hypothetical protein